MSHQPYHKEHFEADLLALGEVPALSISELVQPEVQLDCPVVLADALGSSAVVLFQERADCDLSAAVQTSNTQRPVEHTVDEAGITISAARYTAGVPNLYSLLAYFPEAANGKGDASFYALPNFDFTLPDVSRYVTEREANDLLLETAIPLDGNLMVARPEAEMVHHDYYADKSCSRLSVEAFTPNGVPCISLRVHPKTNEGSFTMLDVAHVARDSKTQRLAYTGRAAMSGTLGDLPVYKRTEEGSLLQLTGVVPGTVEHRSDSGIFTYHNLPCAPFGYEDLLRMMRARETVSNSDALPPFQRSIGVHKALARELISDQSLVYTPVAATPILYRALTEGPDTPYFQNLRRQLGPAFNSESDLITRAQAEARQTWHDALVGCIQVEPSARGLEQSAVSAGIRRTEDASILIQNSNVYFVGGQINLNQQ